MREVVVGRRYGGFSLFLLLVCPKGFTLPTSSDYSSLTTTYNITNNSTGSTKLRQSPLGFVYTGNYSYGNGSLGEEGSGGYYWSRTAYSGTHAYFLYIGSSRVGPKDNYFRGHGYALRCVGRGEIIFTDWSSNYSFHNSTDTTIIARLARRPPTLIAATSKHAPRSSGSSFFMLTFYHRSEIYDMMVVMVNK